MFIRGVYYRWRAAQRKARRCRGPGGVSCSKRLAVAVLVLAAAPVAAQGLQIVTGVSLASLGVYAAVADRDCDIPLTRTAGGSGATARVDLVGEQPELPAELAGGLAGAWIGGLTAVQSPSRSEVRRHPAGPGSDDKLLPVDLEAGGHDPAARDGRALPSGATTTS